MSLRGLIVVSVLLLGGCSHGSTNGGVTAQVSSDQQTSSIPEIARWESQMRSFGLTTCQALKRSDISFDEALAGTYYDAAWVFYQIGDYLDESAWYECASAALKIYRDRYVLPNNGAIPGYWNFSRGLTEDYLRTGEERSKEAVLLLARNGAFARDSTRLEETVSSEMSREVAYVITAYLNAEELGAASRARLRILVDHALGHLNQWFESGAAPYVRPFMVALTAQALIQYSQRYGDERIKPALIRAADLMWERMWSSGVGAFTYTDRVVPSGGREPSPDLNLLIAPLYGWLYHETGEPRFLERGDAIFAGGVRGAYLSSPKQFNQNYRWSIRYIEWRGGR